MVEITATWIGPDGEGGIEVFHQAIEALTERLSDWTPVMERAADIFELATAQQFATQGAYGGTPWKPLADSTLKRRESTVSGERKGIKWMSPIKKGTRRQGQRGLGTRGEFNSQILSGGPLEESFTDGGEGHVEEITPTSLTWGSDLQTSDREVPHCLALIHQFGTEHVPARPILVYAQETLDQLEVAVSEYINSSVQEAGWGGDGEQMEMGAEFGMKGLSK